MNSVLKAYRADSRDTLPAKHRVLLVEDNPGDADLTSERLVDAPKFAFDILHVVTLADALTALNKTPVDAVIVDLNLPDSVGLETLISIKQAAGSAPIIVVSGMVDDTLRHHAMDAGATEVFTKHESNSRLFSRSVLYVIERNRAQEQRRQVETLLATTPDAILVVNQLGMVRYVNQAALQLFGRRREDFIGELLGFSARDVEPQEIVIPRQGDARLCEMRVVPFEWQGEPAVLGSIRDLTELKNSQREAIDGKKLAENRANTLRRLLNEIAALARTLGFADVGDATVPVLNARPDDVLSDETLAGVLTPFEAAFRGYAEANTKLAAQNRELSDAKTAIEAVNRELESFSYSVAHDLRGPLSVIDGFCYALLQDQADKFDDKGRKHLNFIREAATRMEQLINDLLQLAHISQADLKRSPVNISCLAWEVATELQVAYPDRQVEFIVSDGLTVEADANLIRIVLENLLGNAHKFTSKRHDARIKLGVLHESGEDVYFVHDNGAGFDSSRAGKLFGVFQRLHSQQEFKGTGIGLSIVKRIVERHGGKIWAESAPGEGATFFFSLQSSLPAP
jgi:signal transduction histidine kinase